jgi:uncharacterized membrane protein
MNCESTVQVQPELTFTALSLLIITLLPVILVVLSLVSMWKENQSGQAVRGIFWFYVVIAGSCAVIYVIAG